MRLIFVRLEENGNVVTYSEFRETAHVYMDVETLELFRFKLDSGIVERLKYNDCWETTTFTDETIKIFQPTLVDDILVEGQKPSDAELYEITLFNKIKGVRREVLRMARNAFKSDNLRG